MELSKIKECEKYAEAPRTGTCLAYFRRKVILVKYEGLDELEKLLSDTTYGELLEVHLFDNDKEFRAISSESRRYSSGIICHLTRKDENDDGGEYAETAQLDIRDRKNPFYGKKLTIINHLKVEEGMAYVDDYRMRLEGEE